MSNLYLKLHPSCVAWVFEDKYGVITLSTNLVDNGDLIKKELGSKVVNPNEIIVEKPFLKLLGDNQRVIADSIIHVQRNFGMLLYILNELYRNINVNHISSKVARVTVYKREYITKDVQLSEASVLLKGLKNTPYRPLDILSLHDVMVLKSYWERHNGDKTEFKGKTIQ